MAKYANNQISETTDEVIVQELTDENNSPTFVREFLKDGFLSSAVDTLFYARRHADLTQAQVAERLNTKQAAIARLEADSDGSMSLRRYVEVALACGMVPLNIVLAPIESACNFVIAYPDLPLTQTNYDTWLLTKETRPMSEPHRMQSTVVLSHPTVTVSQTTKTSTQNSTEYSNQLPYSVRSEEQSTTNQCWWRLAA